MFERIILTSNYFQNAERKLEGGNSIEYSDSEQSDSESSSDEEHMDGACRVADTSDEEEEHQPSRLRKHDYQNVSQLEWDNSTM